MGQVTDEGSLRRSPPLAALDRRLAAGEIVVLDGGTGTELQRRGVPMDREAWSATALLTHPEVVQAVHEDYVRAGADVIVANSFATNRPLLERAGLGDRVREMNLAVVRLARQAVAAAGTKRSVAVAGSINIWHPPVSDAAARADLREQAELFAEGGVDLIALEMMTSVREATLATAAARATGLPVWLGVSVKRGEDGAVLLLGGERLDDSLGALRDLGAAALLVMHSHPDVTTEALALLQPTWRGTLGAYACVGEFTMPDWRWTDVLDPQQYAACASRWIALGARIVGGCCGTGPEHVAALRRLHQ